MKNFLIYFAALTFIFSASACKPKDKSPLVPDNALNPDLIKNPASGSGENKSDIKLPEFRFKTESYDFGMITEGEKVSYSFSFVNTGNEDLIITDAKASCGCTVPEFSKEPVPPGKSGVINVVFDSSGKDGYQRKEIFIKANTIPSSKKLIITGTVIKKKK
jgi:hypothetical protein